MCALCLASLPLTLAWAQAVPPAAADNQELLRQQERERVFRQQREAAPDVRLERPRAPAAAGRLPDAESPCFNIDRILLGGDAAEQFQWVLDAADRAADGVVDAASGRCLGASGINLVMRRLQNAIVSKGYVTARVLAAPQDLSAGTLKLTLIPGRIRSIRFAADTADRATQWNAVPARPGDLLNIRDIEQALENFKRVPTAEADIQITPAEGVDAQPGESDLLIAWRQNFPFRLSVAVDDGGATATGKQQGAVTLSYDNWWTLNDLFYVSFNRDLVGGDPSRRGTQGHTAHYSLPFGYWLLGLTASAHRYHQAVAGANQTYIYSGESQNSDIKLSRLVYRDAARKTSLSLRGWTRSSQNYIDDTEVAVQRRRMAGWDIGAAHREFIGAATLDANLNYRRGTGAMNALPAPEEAFGEGSARPAIVTADARFNAVFAVGGQSLRYTAAWRAQWERTPLVPQDRFAIGGRHTVRGFDGESVLAAERGWLIRNDLGLLLGNSGQELYLGLDHGEVGGRSAELLVGRRLSGAVLGLRGGHKGFSWDVFAGRPLAKPEGFKTARNTGGFNLSWTL